MSAPPDILVTVEQQPPATTHPFDALLYAPLGRGPYLILALVLLAAQESVRLS